MDALTHLYPKVSSGACVIIDDYFLEACRRAVTDYREAHGITRPLVKIDEMSVYWLKK